MASGSSARRAGLARQARCASPYSECLAFPARPACLVQLSCADAGSGILHHDTLRSGDAVDVENNGANHGLASLVRLVKPP
jgi:hypothetical protein